MDSLTADTPWEWLETTVTHCLTDVPPVVRIMLADREEAAPLLRGRYAACADPALRLALARLLLWHHDETGVQDVLAAIRRDLAACEGLPRRAGSLNYGQMLPDHGLMPECVYLVNALAHAPQTPIVPLMTEVLERLEAMTRDWYDLRAGIYCWCETFAWTALRRRDTGLLPLIRRVLRLP